MTEHRPRLNELTDESELRRWYWTVDELQSFAREMGVRTAGPKAELVDRLAAHLSGRPEPETAGRRRTADRIERPLELTTVIPPRQRATQELRDFFKHHVGRAFKFDGHMRRFLFESNGASLGDAVEYWHRTRDAVLPQQSESLEFNRFTAAWHRQHPNGTPAEARAAWSVFRSSPRDRHAATNTVPNGAASSRGDSGVNEGTRNQQAAKALHEYANGPNAPIEATRRALERAEAAEGIILVEGISDQIAVEALANRHGRALDQEGIAVVPVGGAQAVLPYLRRFGPEGDNRSLAGLCDADAAETFRRSLTEAGLGDPSDDGDMAALGFYVSTEDLEDELIRAVGTDGVEAVIESQGEGAAWRSFQHQPEWRHRPIDAQLHRFLGTKARRSLRYARLLTEIVELDRVPRPLDAVLAHIQTSR